MFFPRRRRLRRYTDTGASVGVGEAEGLGQRYTLPFIQSFSSRRHAYNLAEFTPSRYETAHRLDVTMVISKVWPNRFRMRFVESLQPAVIGLALEYEILEKCRKLNPAISMVAFAEP